LAEGVNVAEGVCVAVIDDVTVPVPVGVADAVPVPETVVVGVCVIIGKTASVGEVERDIESEPVGVPELVEVLDTVVEAVGVPETVSVIVIGLSRNSFAEKIDTAETPRGGVPHASSSKSMPAQGAASAGLSSAKGVAADAAARPQRDGHAASSQDAGDATNQAERWHEMLAASPTVGAWFSSGPPHNEPRAKLLTA